MSSRGAWIILILGLLCAVAEITGRYQPAPRERSTWLIGDCSAYRDVTRSILENGSVDYRLVNPRELARYRPGQHRTLQPSQSNVAQTVDGELVPLRSILMPLVMVLPYAAAKEYGLLAANVAQCILLALLVYWLAARYFSVTAAIAAGAGFLAASIVRNYMYNVSPDVLGTVLILGGTLLVWKEGARPWQLCAGGALLGLSLWLRPLNLVGTMSLLPAFVASLRARRPLAQLTWPCVGLVLGAGGFLILNTVWFGSPLVTSYDRTYVLHDGLPTVVSHRANMNRAFWEAIVPTLFTSPHSLLQTAPYWPLFVVALVPLVRRRAAETFALVVMSFAPVIFLFKYDYWNASHFGNRFMFLPAALTAVAIAWVVDRWLPGEGPAKEGARGAGHAAPSRRRRRR